MDLPLNAADHAKCLAEIDLGMPGRMHQRHEHLLASLTPTRDVILHDRDLARKAVLVAQTLEDALGCMPLLLRSLFVGSQDRIDDPHKRIELGPEGRLRANITRRHRELQHLGHSPGIDAEPFRRRPHADPFDQHRVPHTCV